MRPSFLALAGLAFLPAFAGCTCGKGSSGPAPAASSGAAPAASASTSARETPHVPAPVRQGNVVARSPHDDVLYVADEDASTLHIVPLPFDPAKLALAVALPGRPAQVLPLDDRILVTIRDPGLLLILRPDAQTGAIEAARVALPADAWGIAITEDEKTALVTSAWTHAVSAVDLAGPRLRWTVDVAREPRGVAITRDGRAYVSHLVGAALARIDDIGAEKPVARSVDLPPSPLRTSFDHKLQASLGYALALSPDGRRLFAARHALGASGPNTWFGAATVDVLLTRDDKPLAPRRVAPPVTQESMMGSGSSDDPALAAPWEDLTQPRALVYRKSNDTLLLVSEGQGAVAVLDAMAIDPSAAPRRVHRLSTKEKSESLTCGAPSGIALSSDERTAFVFCRSTSHLAVMRFSPDSEWKADVTLSPLGAPPADKALAEGKSLFYDATDDRVSGGLGCAGCHPEGRDDGFAWHEIDSPFGEGRLFQASGGGRARQTPLIAGRVAASGPYGWHAESPDIAARILAGFDLHRWGPPRSKPEKSSAQALAKFAREGLAPPPRSSADLDAQQARGKALFNSPEIGCAACHAPATGYTDRAAVPLRQLPPPPDFDADDNASFKTPSLLFVGGTAPYYHDGSVATLEELVDRNDDRMGKTNQLSKEDRAALVAFLKTL